jgi:hypothetical protein
MVNISYTTSILFAEYRKVIVFILGFGLDQKMSSLSMIDLDLDLDLFRLHGSLYMI